MKTTIPETDQTIKSLHTRAKELNDTMANKHSDHRQQISAANNKIQEQQNQLSSLRAEKDQIQYHTIDTISAK